MARSGICTQFAQVLNKCGVEYAPRLMNNFIINTALIPHFCKLRAFSTTRLIHSAQIPHCNNSAHILPTPKFILCFYHFLQDNTKLLQVILTNSKQDTTLILIVTVLQLITGISHCKHLLFQYRRFNLGDIRFWLNLTI